MLRKIFTDLLTLIALNSAIVWLLLHFKLITSEGAWDYGILATGGLAVMIVFNLLARLGIKFLIYHYLRFLFLSDNAIFTPEILWNNPFIRSTVYWGLIGALISRYPTLAIIIVAAQVGWRIKSGLPNLGLMKSILKPDRTPPLSYSFNTDKGTLRMDNIFRGLLIIGGAGSGKSKSLVEPIIRQAGQKGFTGIVYDYKFPTLAEVVNGAYPDGSADPSGIQKYFINFVDLSRSHRVNPLSPELLENASYARELAGAIITNLDPQAARKRDFWIQSAEALLTGTIWYLREERPEFCTLPHAVSLLLTHDRRQLIELLQGNEQVAGMIASVASAIDSENTIGGMFATLQNQLSVLNTPEIFWVMSGQDLTLDLNNPQSRKILVLGNNPSLSNTYSPLLSLIATAALKQLNQAEKSPSMVLLDEAPTIIIPKFDQLPATARSNQVATIVVAQDLAQLEDRYGLTQTETIISNLGNQAYGRTTNPKTAERISKLFGKEDRMYESRSVNMGDGRGSVSRSQNLQQRERIEAQDTMRLPTGVFAGLVAEGNQQEFYCRFREENSGASPLPIVQQVSPEMVRQNFKNIVGQAKEILDQKGGNDWDSPLPDSFLDM